MIFTQLLVLGVNGAKNEKKKKTLPKGQGFLLFCCVCFAFRMTDASNCDCFDTIRAVSAYNVIERRHKYGGSARFGVRRTVVRTLD